MYLYVLKLGSVESFESKDKRSWLFDHQCRLRKLKFVILTLCNFWSIES